MSNTIRKKNNKPIKIRQFTEEEKNDFGVVHISQIRQRERSNAKCWQNI